MSNKKLKEIIKVEGRNPNDDEEEHDILDEFLKREAKEAVRRAKLAKIKEYELESRLKLKELERKLKELEGGEKISENEESKLTPMDVEIAKMLKDLPEKDRSEVLAYLTYLKSAGRAEPSTLLIPLIIAAKQSNPSAAPLDVVRAVNEAVKTYKDLTSKGLSETNIVKEVLSTVKELTGGNIKDQLASSFLEIMKQQMTNPPRGFWDQIMEDPNKLNTLRKLFGSGTDSKTMIELEKLRQQHEKEMTKLKMKMLELKYKMLSEKRREKLYKSYGKRIAKAVIDGLLGSEEAKASEQEYSQPRKLPEGWVSKKCEVCGNLLTFKPGEAKFIICPKCGTKYMVETTSGGK